MLIKWAEECSFSDLMKCCEMKGMNDGGGKSASKDELKEKMRDVLHPPDVELKFDFEK